MRLLSPSSQAYQDIGRNQVNLTEVEEIRLVNRYKEVRGERRGYILGRARCVRHFMKRYKEVRAAGRSVAKLSADYNPRKAGLNKGIEEKFKRTLDPSKTRTWNGKYLNVILGELNLSDEVFNDMEQYLRPTAKLQAIKDEISTIENTLVCSLLMAGQEIAKRYASNLLSIDEADAAQQVNLFLLESVRRYDPDYRTPKGHRIKLCTFSYGRSEQLLKEWILTNSRLVRVPRNKMERVLIVVKAYDALVPDDINLFTLAQGANKVLAGRKKLTAGNTFDVDEIDDLIKILMSNYIHLDQPYRRDNRSNSTTIGEMLSKEQPTAEDTIEEHDSRELLIEVMQDNLEDVEFQIIMLRWFHDPTDKVPKALTEVGELLISEYGVIGGGGTAYSRESIRLIEKAAIAKLKDVEEVQKLWSH
jgi:DNA-directed RNA polymerase sigma subunit (sigma70/sigma32)